MQKQPPEFSYKNLFLKIEACNFIETVSSCEFCWILAMYFLAEHFWVTASAPWSNKNKNAVFRKATILHV